MTGDQHLPYGWAPPIADTVLPAPTPGTRVRRLAAALFDVVLFVATLGAGRGARARRRRAPREGYPPP